MLLPVQAVLDDRIDGVQRRQVIVDREPERTQELEHLDMAGELRASHDLAELVAPERQAYGWR